MAQFRLLGAFEVTTGRNGAQSVTPRAPKLRTVLALLLLQANQVVHLDTIIEELWGANPPQSAVTIVQTYIYHLRKIFAAEKIDPPWPTFRRAGCSRPTRFTSRNCASTRWSCASRPT